MAWELPGGYVLVRPIGAGAFAEVHEGIAPGGERVAVKILVDKRPMARKCFGREVKVLRALPPSRHVARYRDSGDAPGGRPFLVMELVDGYSLGQLLASGHRLGPRDASKLVVQLCDAFGSLHHLGVAHGDVNPDNILITSDGRTAKLIDFGLVRDAQGLLRLLEQESVMPGQEFEEELDSGMLAGSPQYMAPEQIADAFADPGTPKGTDTPSDVYGLGVILHQLLLGSVPRPFEPERRGGRAWRAEVRAYCERRLRDSAEVELPSGLPRSLEAVLRCSLAREPKQRYPDARDLRVALLRFLDESRPPRGERRGRDAGGREVTTAPHRGGEEEPRSVGGLRADVQPPGAQVERDAGVAPAPVREPGVSREAAPRILPWRAALYAGAGALAAAALLWLLWLGAWD